LNVTCKPTENRPLVYHLLSGFYIILFLFKYLLYAPDPPSKVIKSFFRLTQFDIAYQYLLMGRARISYYPHKFAEIGVILSSSSIAPSSESELRKPTLCLCGERDLSSKVISPLGNTTSLFSWTVVKLGK